MALLTQAEKDEIIRRRGSKCESSATTHRGRLEIHHVDRNPHNNDASNLKVYCKEHHPAPGT